VVNPFESVPDPTREAQQIQEIADLTVKLLEKRYPSPKPILRGVHAKAHGCVDASFEILTEIPAEMQVGLFARPGARHKAVVRFSNAAVLVEPDLKNGKNGSRGMAIKVFNVDGDVLFDDHGARNQDFLMINTPVFAFANVEDYLMLTKVLLAHDDVPDSFFAPLKVDVPGITPEQKQRIARTFGVTQQIQARPVANPLEVAYFSAAPFLFGGDRVMRYSAVPAAGTKSQRLPRNPSANYLREALQRTMNKTTDIVFDFQVQVRKAGESDLFIEDATQAWSSMPRPVTVARLTIPAPQRNLDSETNRRRCERRVFTPWHALAEHQPLGGINRLRRAVYLASAKRRQ